VLVLVGAHALRSSAAMVAAMTGHRAFRANMNLSLQRKAVADDRIEFASASPRACRRWLAPTSALSAFGAGTHTAYLKLLSGVKSRANVGYPGGAP
jgi:hypothetical protein